jgi:hypothetical protein
VTPDLAKKAILQMYRDWGWEVFLLLLLKI